jgi:hypothetical protein
VGGVLGWKHVVEEVQVEFYTGNRLSGGSLHRPLKAQFK